MGEPSTTLSRAGSRGPRRIKRQRSVRTAGTIEQEPRRPEDGLSLYTPAEAIILAPLPTIAAVLTQEVLPTVALHHFLLAFGRLSACLLITKAGPFVLRTALCQVSIWEPGSASGDRLRLRTRTAVATAGRNNSAECGSGTTAVP